MRLTTANLINLSNGQTVATLSESQLRILRDHLEPESETDSNFSITAEMIEDLRQEGAVDLASVLASVLRDAPEMRVGYAPVGGFGSAVTRGRLLDLETFSPLVGYKIEIYHEGVVFDHLLGWCYADLQGRFDYRFNQTVDAASDIELRVLDTHGKEIGSVGVFRDGQANLEDIFVSANGDLIAPVLDPAAAAICPHCGALYREGVNFCNDCQLPIRRLNEVPIQIAAQSPFQPETEAETDELVQEAVRISQKPTCPECQTLNRRGAEFCRKCGYPFSLGTLDSPGAM